MVAIVFEVGEGLVTTDNFGAGVGDCVGIGVSVGVDTGGSVGAGVGAAVGVAEISAVAGFSTSA